MPQTPVEWLVKPIVKFYRRSVLRDPFLVSVKQWKRDRGDQNLRLNYDLNQDSVVLDIGGYAGDFAEAIHQKYGCRVLVFEPMPRFYQQCAERFAENDAVSVYRFGLGAADAKMLLSNSDDASSFCRSHPGQDTVAAEIRDIATVWNECDLDFVDLVKMNIEGGEYPLLERMIEADLAEHVGNFQVQFHDFIPNAESMRTTLRKSLSQTHEEQWCYDFVWENWNHRRYAA